MPVQEYANVTMQDVTAFDSNDLWSCLEFGKFHTLLNCPAIPEAEMAKTCTAVSRYCIRLQVKSPKIP
jgi:hypothetical protein